MLFFFVVHRCNVKTKTDNVIVFERRFCLKVTLVIYVGAVARLKKQSKNILEHKYIVNVCENDFQGQKMAYEPTVS